MIGLHERGRAYRLYQEGDRLYSGHRLGRRAVRCCAKVK